MSQHVLCGLQLFAANSVPQSVCPYFCVNWKQRCRCQVGPTTPTPAAMCVYVSQIWSLLSLAMVWIWSNSLPAVLSAALSRRCFRAVARTRYSPVCISSLHRPLKHQKMSLCYGKVCALRFKALAGRYATLIDLQTMQINQTQHCLDVCLCSITKWTTQSASTGL